MPAAYTGPYQINPLELPSNQNAAALVNTEIVDYSGASWASSPLTAGGAGQSSFTDVPTTGTVSRTSTAQAALRVEQARLQNRNDILTRDISIIEATP
jgi:hypothetical protein